MIAPIRERQAPGPHAPLRVSRAFSKTQRKAGESMAQDNSRDMRRLGLTWDRIKAVLRKEIGEDSYDKWLREVRLHTCVPHETSENAPQNAPREDSGDAGQETPGQETPRSVLTLLTASAQGRDWLHRWLQTRLEELWRAAYPDVSTVRLQLAQVAETPRPPHFGTAAGTASSHGGGGTQAAEHETLGTGRDPHADFFTQPLPRYRFANFVLDESNKLAFQIARDFAASPAAGACVVFYGPSGFGKTHLLNAVHAALAERGSRCPDSPPHRDNRDKGRSESRGGQEILDPGHQEGHQEGHNGPPLRVISTNSDRFLHFFVKSIRNPKDNLSLKDRLLETDVFLLDDLHFLCGKPQTQIALLHGLEGLFARGKTVLVTSDTLPSDLEGLDERLRNRFCSALSARMGSPSKVFYRAFMRRKAQDFRLHLAPDVEDFLNQQAFFSPREVEGVLRRLKAWSSLLERPLELPEARERLADLLVRPGERRITIDAIQKKISEYYKISTRDMTSKRRAREIARPRQVAMYISKELTSRSLPEIGRRFDRDHSTVIHAIKTVRTLMNRDHAFRDEVTHIKHIVAQGTGPGIRFG